MSAVATAVAVPVVAAVITTASWRMMIATDGNFPPLVFVMLWAPIFGPFVSTVGSALAVLLWPTGAGRVGMGCLFSIVGFLLYWFTWLAVDLVFPDPNFVPIV